MNHIYTLARRHPVGVEITIGNPWSIEQRTNKLPSSQVQIEESTLFTMLANAPAELCNVVDRILKDGFDGGAYLKRHWYYDTKGRWRRHVPGLRETEREYWERMMGSPDQVEDFIDYIIPYDNHSPPKSSRFEQLAAMSRQYQQAHKARGRMNFKRLAEASRRYEKEKC